MQSDSVKNECTDRILALISENAQRNINAHIADLSAAAANGSAMTPAQVTDCETAAAIHAWIGRPTGMLGASDALIADNDQQWWLDGKWPVWDATNAGWTTFVAQF